MIEAENQSSEAQYPPPPNSGILEKSSSSFGSRKFLIVGGAVLLLLVPGLVAYVFAQNQTLKSQLSSPLTCEYQSQTYQVGEGFPSTDGCNSCTCTNAGEVVCTVESCEAEDGQPSNDPLSNWNSFINSEMNYQIQLPSDWHLVEHSSSFPNNQSYSSTTGDWIDITLSSTSPEACRGDCPTIQFTSPINLNDLSGIKYQGMIGSVGGNQPHAYEAVSFKHYDKYLIITIHPSIAQEDDIGIVVPMRKELTALFNQILSTFEFTKNMKESVIVNSPKYSDSPSELNQYQVMYEKPSSSTKYQLSSDIYQKLKIYNDNYEVLISFPTDGGSQTFDEIPLVKIINNVQFGDVNRISSENNSEYYTYSNEFDADCTNWSPKPKGGCGLMQVGYSNPESSIGTTYVSITCKAFEKSGVDSCDKVVSTLQVKQI